MGAVARPWGAYESLKLSGGYQVKELAVSPGGRLSLQYHRHRSEHWIVVSGTVNATVNGLTRTMRPGESIYVPLGAVHRLANPGTEVARLIEVQCGDYLGEDDIVRIEDDYGIEERTNNGH